MQDAFFEGCIEQAVAMGFFLFEPMREILSPDNPAYMQLIEEQRRGEFRPGCKSCDYESIYHMRAIHRRNGVAVQSIESFKDRLREAGISAAPASVDEPRPEPAQAETPSAAPVP